MKLQKQIDLTTNGRQNKQLLREEFKLLQKAADEFTSDESTKSAVSAKADEVQLELDHKMLSWLEGLACIESAL